MGSLAVVGSGNQGNKHLSGTVEPMSAFTVTNLCVSYGEKVACHNISIQIPSREITAIIGPSGSGKSTFLCCLNRMTGCLDECTISGNVCFKGLDLYSPDMELTSLRRQVGMVFQKPNPLPFSIWRNLELPLKQHGVKSKAEVADKIEDALKRAQLWDEVKDRLRESALKLSGGQQQRLCIARALALEPEVLLLDEPCSALDPMSTSKIENLLLDIKQHHTVVIVTHNIVQAKRVSDHVAVFWNEDNRGVLMEAGGAQKIFDNPAKPVTGAFLEAGF